MGVKHVPDTVSGQGPDERLGTSSAIAALTAAFADPLADARRNRHAGLPVAISSTRQVPWEVLRAAGFATYVYRPTHDVYPHAQPYLEEQALGRHGSSVTEAAMRGELATANVFVCSRASEQDYKTYLYLREFVRQGVIDRLPPILLYDILHTRTAEARAYGIERTKQLWRDATMISGAPTDEDRLLDAILESNASREVMRRLQSLRQGRPRVSGVSALTLLGASALVDRLAYTTLLEQAVSELETAETLAGPRLLVVGPGLDDTRLHELLESSGAVVVAEDGSWGARGIGRDVSSTGDLCTAIFDKHYEDIPASRSDLTANDAWVGAFTHGSIDGVVFYLPLEDSVAGWDYPRLRDRVTAAGIPTLLIRDDATDPAVSARWRHPVSAFVERIVTP
jgi:hypothetical protein